MKTAVVAIGGNAILRAGESGSAEVQLANLEVTCGRLAEMIAQGYDIVITHGNGPQVGNILLQQEAGKALVPPMPLDVCVAESQGQIGYMLQQTLQRALAAKGHEKTVASVITQVVVDAEDPAFQTPTKPIGPYFTREEAELLEREKGWRMMEDEARGGFRRVVPSPVPVDILEKEAIKRLVFNEDGGYMVIAAGGGGVPVIATEHGYRGVEAVVDKDLASSVLASCIGERLLIFLTDVPHVYLNYGTEDQTPISLVSAEEIRMHHERGEFPPGTMGPKIEAALLFLGKGGKEVVITNAEMLLAALDGRAGTKIVP
ncbi:MAG: carbamate kinase [Candidatus Thermoplasmatota archaeon]